jgi:hypothetical protein
MPGPHFHADRPAPADTREAIARARRTCLAAARAIEMATATVEASRVLSAMREHWRQVWSELQGADPDYMAVCCAYCTHVRSRDGVWGAIPPGINEIIHGTSRIDLTHGICPECQPIAFPAAKASPVVTVDTGQLREYAYPVG